MAEKYDCIKSLNAFVEMYDEQQNKIKNILNDSVSLLSINSLKILNVSISHIIIPPIDTG